MLLHVALPLGHHCLNLFVQFGSPSAFHAVGAFEEPTLAGHFKALLFVTGTGTAPALQILQPTSHHLQCLCPGPEDSVGNGALDSSGFGAIPDIVVSGFVVLPKDGLHGKEVATNFVECAKSPFGEAGTEAFQGLQLFRGGLVSEHPGLDPVNVDLSVHELAEALAVFLEVFEPRQGTHGCP